MAEHSRYSDVSKTTIPSLKSTLTKSSILTTSKEWEPISLPIGVACDHHSGGLHSIKSTELICNEEECFTFKHIADPGIHEAYVIGADLQVKMESNEEIYLRLAESAGIAPIKRILNSLKGHHLGLEHYGLDPRQMKPLTEALMHNVTVQELNLKGNVLTEGALYHLGGLISNKAGCLRKLNLQHCKIGPEGVKLLVSGLEMCRLEELDLSHNNIEDRGMKILASKLKYNLFLQTVNLSHNGLTHLSGIWLADTLEENIALKHLNLAWNQISEEPGVKKFLTTTAESNESLLSLNLSWNSLGGDRIATIIKNFIGQHRTLQELDLSHNRLGSISGNARIAKGINNSETLKTLNLSYNGHTANSAFVLLSNINKTKLITLLLVNVWVKPEFEKLQKYGSFKVVVEGVSGGSHIKGPDIKAMLLKRANFLGYKPKKKKDRKDFGWFLLRLQKAGSLVPVKRAKFDMLLQEDNIIYDEGLTDELAKQFKNEEKKIDLNLMLENYLELFPETSLPVPKEKKKKKSPKSRESKKYNKETSLKDTEEPNKELKDIPDRTLELTENRSQDSNIDAEDKESNTGKTKVSGQETVGSATVDKPSNPRNSIRKSKKSQKEIIFTGANYNQENNTDIEQETEKPEETLKESVVEEAIPDITDRPTGEEIARDTEDELQSQNTVQ